MMGPVVIFCGQYVGPEAEIQSIDSEGRHDLLLAARRLKFHLGGQVTIRLLEVFVQRGDVADVVHRGALLHRDTTVFL